MSTQTNATDSAAFNIGWMVLLIISALATLNHIMLPLYGDPVALALGWTGYSLYATLVVAIPFRRGEKMGLVHFLDPGDRICLSNSDHPRELHCSVFDRRRRDGH